MQDPSLLTSLTPVLFKGADARKFLQGQLTNDVRTLTPERALLGSCNTGQGRVQAVVTVLEREEGIAALFPTATVERQLVRLRASIYSTKVSFEVVPWTLVPHSEASARTLVDALPERPGDCIVHGDATLLRWWSADLRYLSIASRSAAEVRGASAREPRVDVCDQDGAARVESWHRADIVAGLPQVYLETLSSFVPQMLNLDLLNGISFDKGCYIGQEVVARARRGGVSRRMLGFRAACPPPAPGTLVMNGGEEAGQVVDAAPTDTGCQLLAVVSFDQVSGSLSLAGQPGAELTSVALPYPVPLERR